ncbi:TetR family transcriptional regulator [Thermobifida cellulosilytica TB100]|uniref:TetR family transcriptional regulator n=1 Tax=Thermobifida cellulosilytica TB100 TaxID=665004 RepID=A0A147KKD0_THECS|nr:TetR family transcriptional regulator [Thermobifida cellulosilytica TB100]
MPTGNAPPAASPQPRRARLREAAFTEIKAIARRRLVEQGAEGVSLRAIAREMGMTAPALYRYFASLNDLLLSLQADFFAELSAWITDANTGVPEEDVDGRLLASLRAFRSWALANRAEFALLFGPRPPHQPSGPHEEAALREGQRFASTFLTLFNRLLEEDRIPLPDSGSFTPELCRQLEQFARSAGIAGRHSEGELRVLTACWVRLYGLVCMEVFHNMVFGPDDMEPLFEAELADLLASVGVRYRPPEG